MQRKPAVQVYWEFSKKFLRYILNDIFQKSDMHLYFLSLQTNLVILAKEHFALHNSDKKMQIKGMEEVSSQLPETVLYWISFRVMYIIESFKLEKTIQSSH